MNAENRQNPRQQASTDRLGNSFPVNVLFHAFLFFLLLVCTAMIRPAEAVELAPRLHKITLDNGLNIIVKETPGTRVATVQFWVKAGSIYEEAEEAGITHLIEHMIFKGTPSRGPGEIAGGIESAGGRINAYTSYEYTVYHATLSSRNWETALTVLADALLHSNFDPAELEREKQVVLEEIRMRQDRPDLALFQELMARAYSTHPYRLPISGTAESVTAISRELILRYIAHHYHPDNFTVVVVGDVQAPQVIAQVEGLLAGLPRSEMRSQPLPQEPPRREPVLFAMNGDINQTQLAMAFPGPAFKSPDTAVVDVLMQILAQGNASRLYEELRSRRGLVYRIDGSAFTPKDPGLLEFTATLETGRVEEALEAALTEIFRLKYDKVSDQELERAKSNLESDFVFNLERAEGQARVLGSFEFLTGDPREDRYLERVTRVTKEDVQRAAALYLTGERLTCGTMAPQGSTVPLDHDRLAALIARAEQTARQAQPASQVHDAYLGGLHRFELSNGIRLLVRENHDVPTVAIRAVFPGGLRGETPDTNGAFAFLSELLPKATEQLDAQTLARRVADLAGSLGGFTGKNTFGLKGDFLSRHLNEGLSLVRDVMLTPALDAAEAEKIRPELLSQLKRQEDNLPALAFREFNRHLFNGHPYALNAQGDAAVIAKLTVEDLRQLYKEYARPSSLVLAVTGNVDAEAVRRSVEELFGNWQEPSAPSTTSSAATILPPDMPAGPNIVTLRRDKQQVHVILGFAGTTLSSPDRFGLEVLDTVLSGQSGRLFSELRDKQSLAYSVSSFSLLGLDTGSFGIYIGTSPDKRDETIKAIWEQLYRVRQELITPEELAKAKNLLISTYELGLQTHSAQAMEMALNETYQLGQDFGHRYAEAIEKVDAATVMAMANKYIQTGNYVLVTVGPDGNGTGNSHQPTAGAAPAGAEQ